MAYTSTIDGAGRLVIPKPLRDRLGLGAGTRLHVTIEGGELVLSPERPEPALVERDGFLVIQLPEREAPHADHREERERQLRRMAAYAAMR